MCVCIQKIAGTTADIDSTLDQSLLVIGFPLTLKVEKIEAIYKFVSGNDDFVLGAKVIRFVCSLLT